MKKLNLPPVALQLIKRDSKLQIFDTIRKKYLVLTPEEWVRQHLVHYLMEEKGFPSGLISLEAGLKYNQLPKRSDILIYAPSGQPLLLVECKAPEVKITESTFHQAVTYNKTIKASYVLLSNGLEHYCFRHEGAKMEALETIPAYQDLV